MFKCDKFLLYCCSFGAAGIIYQLIGQGAEHFAVDKKTGSITVAACPTPGTAPCLDYEEQSEYFLNYKVRNLQFCKILLEFVAKL